MTKVKKYPLYNDGNRKSDCKVYLNTKHHKHKLIYCKTSKYEHEETSWFCNVCNNHYDPDDWSFYCTECDFHLCYECYENEEEEEDEEDSF